MPVNVPKLRIEFEKQIFNTNQFRGLAQGIAQRRANIAQKSMLTVFEESPVTKELEGGIDYAGPSVVRYFRPDVGNGNLYSFIGFPAGTDPVELLRKLLNFPIEVKLSTRSGGTYFFKVLVPTSENIEEATPLPSDYFQGQFSWARAVEEGDGDALHIGQFLAIKASASRSGGGIQVQGINTGSSLEPTPYITPILEAFRKRLQELTS